MYENENNQTRNVPTSSGRVLIEKQEARIAPASLKRQKEVLPRAKRA